MEERQQRIREFLGKFFGDREIGAEEDIFELGFVNSLLALQLVQFLETEFAVTIEDEDLDLDNFRTIQRLDALVARKKGEATGGEATPEEELAHATT